MIEYMNPGSTKAVAEGVDVVGIGEIQGAATDILAATRDASVKSAADALGEDGALELEVQGDLVGAALVELLFDHLGRRLLVGRAGLPRRSAVGAILVAG